MSKYNQFLEALDDSPFANAGGFKTFMYSPEWSNLPPHSEVQEDIIDRCCFLPPQRFGKALW